jgi:DGQHR domain-containing protein
MNTLTNSKEIVWTAPFKQALTYIEASQLKHLHVSTYDTKDPDSPAANKHGYQRNPDEKRFKQIAKYYRDRPDKITPLQISVRVRYDSDIKDFIALLLARKFADIRKRFSSAVMSNIDGQHRSGGLQVASEMYEGFGDTRVPLCLFFGMTYEEEAEMFTIINSSQRKLPKALIETTKGDITERTDMSHSQRVRQIAFGVSRDKDSVWFDQINMTGGRAPGQKVTYEGMRRSTANMFPGELLGRIDAAGIDPLADLAKPFWAEVSVLFPSAWSGAMRTILDPETEVSTEESVPFRLKELVGVASLARLARDIFSSAMEAHVEYGIALNDALKKKMDPLRHVDWEKSPENPYMRSQAGFAGQAELYGVLYKVVYQKEDPEGNPL